MSPPRVRGAVQSTLIQGLRSSLAGRQPRPASAWSAAKPGCALEECAVGGPDGVRSHTSRPPIRTLPAPPSPATMASSMNPSCDMAAPLEGPHANSMSRLCTTNRFQRRGGVRSLSTRRQTFCPLGSISLSSRLLTGPRPRSRNCTAYSAGMARSTARRATTNPLPPLKSKSILSAAPAADVVVVSAICALPEAVGCHSVRGTETALPATRPRCPYRRVGCAGPPRPIRSGRTES